MSGPLGKPPTLPPTPDAATEPPGGRGAPLGSVPLPRLSLGASGRAGGHGHSSLRMRRGGGSAPLGRAPRPPLHAPTQREKLQRAQLQAAQNAAKPKPAPTPTPKAAPIPIAKPEENPQKTRFRNRLGSALARKSGPKQAELAKRAQEKARQAAAVLPHAGPAGEEAERQRPKPAGPGTLSSVEETRRMLDAQMARHHRLQTPEGEEKQP